MGIGMKTVQAYIDSKQKEFANHRFFDVLRQLKSLEELRYFVPELTFWVMTFQDILRLNEERVTDPYLKKIARHHRLEDAGHERWFLHDRNYLTHKASNDEDILWLFGKATRSMRDPAYAILAEVYRSDNEWLNIALLLVVESSGHVFFERVAEQVEKTGEERKLKYFSRSHLDAELSHALFDEEMERTLYATPLPAKTCHDAMRLVDRCYDAFDRMFDGLVIACNRRLELTGQEVL
jgi:hypothetical protein